MTPHFLCQELVPRQRVGEVGNEHPSQAEANTSKEGHGEPWGTVGKTAPSLEVSLVRKRCNADALFSQGT